MLMSSPAGCSRGRSCWTASGARPTSASRARSTCTCATCARSSSRRRASRGTSRRCAASAIASRLMPVGRRDHLPVPAARDLAVGAGARASRRSRSASRRCWSCRRCGTTSSTPRVAEIDRSAKANLGAVPAAELQMADAVTRLRAADRQPRRRARHAERPRRLPAGRAATCPTSTADPLRRRRAQGPAGAGRARSRQAVRGRDGDPDRADVGTRPAGRAVHVAAERRRPHGRHGAARRPDRGRDRAARELAGRAAGRVRAGGAHPPAGARDAPDRRRQPRDAGHRRRPRRDPRAGPRVRRHAPRGWSAPTARGASSSPTPRTSCARRCSRSAASSSCSRTRRTPPRAASSSPRCTARCRA